MRILHVLAERGFSGGENQLLATLRYLQQQDHEQTLVLHHRGEFRARARELGLPFTEQKFRNNYDPLAAMELRRQFSKINPDLIHLACSRSHKIGALARGFRKNLPPIVVTRRMDYPIGNTPFRRWIYGRAVDAVVAISQEVRAAVLAVGVHPDRVHLIHEGVDTGRLGLLREEGRRAQARKRLELRATDFLGVTNASLHKRKAHDVLLEALGRLRVAGGRRIIWLFGGDGPEREQLTAQASRLPAGIEVRIPGQIDYVDDALAAADVFCLPSRYEGLGVALLEALSTGVPCIATRVGGMKEVLVSGESGIHVEPENVDQLAAAIQSLLDDPSLARRLGDAGKQWGREHFDIELMGRKTEALYRDLATAASSSPGS